MDDEWSVMDGGHLPAKTTNAISGGLGAPKQEGEGREE